MGPNALPESTPDNISKATLNPYPLTNEEYRLLKEYIYRKDLLLSENKYSLMFELSERFYDKFSVPIEERTDREAFLEKLLNYNVK